MKSLSRVRLFVTPWTAAHQAPQSMGFSRQEYRSGLPFPSPGDPPDPGIEPRSAAFGQKCHQSPPEESEDQILSHSKDSMPPSKFILCKPFGFNIFPTGSINQLYRSIFLLYHAHAFSLSCAQHFSDPCSLSGSAVHGISQARILEWVAISFSRGSSQPRG